MLISISLTVAVAAVVPILPILTSPLPDTTVKLCKAPSVPSILPLTLTFPLTVVIVMSLSASAARTTSPVIAVSYTQLTLPTIVEG